MPALGGGKQGAGRPPVHAHRRVRAEGQSQSTGRGERYSQPDLRSGFGAKNRPGETQGWVPPPRTGSQRPHSWAGGRQTRGGLSPRPAWGTPLANPHFLNLPTTEGGRRAGRRIRKWRLPPGLARPFMALRLLTGVGKLRWPPGAVSSWPLQVSGERATPPHLEKPSPGARAALANSRAGPGQLGDPGSGPAASPCDDDDPTAALPRWTGEERRPLAQSIAAGRDLGCHLSHPCLPGVPNQEVSPLFPSAQAPPEALPAQNPPAFPNDSTLTPFREQNLPPSLSVNATQASSNSPSSGMNTWTQNRPLKASRTRDHNDRVRARHATQWEPVKFGSGTGG